MEAHEEILNWARAILPNSTNVEKARHGDQSTVYHLSNDSGSYVLKLAKNLEGEWRRLSWLSGKTLVPEVIDFKSFDDTDALLMTELPGKNLASHKTDWEHEVVADRLALAIRVFHDIDSTDCPFGSPGEGKVLAHGDACLPNFIFDGDHFSGYIDVGDIRIDYPEADLSAAVWSLERNLGRGYGSRFLKAYGYPDSSVETVEKLRLQYEIADVARIIKSNTRTLYILTGYPYAGKSYVAHQILKETDTVLISIDDIFYEHGFDWNTNVLPNTSQWQLIFDEAYKRTREPLKEDKNVLYDSTNQTIASREKLREVAQSASADSYVLFVQSDEATIWRRWEGNAQNPKRPVVGKELVAQTIAAFEPPMEKERVLVIRN